MRHLPLVLLVATLCGLSLSARAATDPIITSWMTTNSAKYARVYKTTTTQANGNSITTWTNQDTVVYSDIQLVAYSSSWVYVQYSGLSSYVMGPWLTPGGGIFNFWPVNQNGFRKFTRTPTAKTGTKYTTPAAQSGYFVNGVAIFNSLDGKAYDGSGLTMSQHFRTNYFWHQNAPVAEDFNFDPGFGHQPNSGVYHTHQQPIALRYQLSDHVDYNSSSKTYSESSSTTTNHSPIIGWALDGYPIYGPYGYSVSNNAASAVTRMRSGYAKRDGSNGTDIVSNNRSVIPAWYARFRTNLGPNIAYSTNAGTSRPTISTTYPLGNFAQDFSFLSDCGKTMGTDYDLDEYNGRFCVTPEYPSGTYAYFSCVDSSYNATYPYVFGFQFYGVTNSASVTTFGETVTTNYTGGADTWVNINSPPTTDANTKTVTLVWSSVEGGTYQLETSSNAVNWSTQIASISSGGISTTTNYTGLNGSNYARVTRTALATYDTNTAVGITIASVQTDTEGFKIDSLSIATQPVSQSVVAGSSATFSVVASGITPFSYQWKFNGSAINGATLSSYTIGTTTTNDTGTYSVVVTNVAGSITSSNATLTVYTPPSIDAQPVSLVVTQGTGASFSVVASGTAPLKYQWKTNGVNISNATNSTYSIGSATTNNAATYSVVVTNLAGSVTSSNATLTVYVSPFIITQPAAKSATVGSNVTFSVVAGGTAPLGYQWRTNGVNISGAISASYTITGVTTNDAATYSVVVSNLIGTLTSSNATLTVNIPPSIDTQPVSLVVTQNTAASFTVAASGTAPLKYQWRTNGVNISNATNSTYTIASATTNNVATYSVVVTNLAGTVTSSNATLTVYVPPFITTQPTSKSATVGSNVTFSVVAGGTAPLSYQWQTNGTFIVNATNSSYTITGVTTNDALTYSVVITNVAGMLTSSNATLTVNVPPSITTQPQSQTTIVGSNVTFSVVADGTAPLKYQWRTNGVNINNATNSTYNIASATTNSALTYSVVITNLAGTVASSNATLTVYVPPSITTQPQSQTVNSGSNVTFSVVATGTAPLGYQWLFNGTNIDGAVTNSYTVVGATTNNAGTYSVVVSNIAGSVTSSNATLAINGAPVIQTQPVDQTVIVGTNVSFSVVATGTAPLKYQWRTNGVNISNATNSTYNIAAVTTNQAGTYSVVVSNLAGTVTSSNATLVVNVPAAITSQPQSQTVIQGTNVTLSVAASGTAPISYQWRLAGTNLIGATASNYVIGSVSTNDAGTYSVIVSNVAATVTSSNATLTVNVPPFIMTQPQTQSVTVSNNVTFTVVAGGTATLSYRWRSNGVVIASATSSTFSLLSVTTNAAATYSVIVSNAYGTVTSSNAVLTVNVPPSISTQPQPVTAIAGSNAVFSVTATGTATLGYQWRLEGTNLAGANAAVYTITGLATNQAGNYSVVVSNVAGTVTSSNALLTVVSAPSISVQPQSQTAIVGSNVTFSVTASGTGTLSYRWRSNGVVMASATSSNYVIASAATNHAATYSVIVSNIYGTVTSSNAVLTINALPVINTQPQSQTVNPGVNVTFFVIASGTGPLGYQWRYAGTNIPGATATNYTLNSVTSTNAGTYSVVVSNLAGTVTSSNATLSINGPPSITGQPSSQSVAPGGTATFTVAAAGTPPLAYHWRFNGSTVSVGSSGTYSVAGAAVANIGGYSVVVSNLAGKVTSTTAYLTLITNAATGVPQLTSWRTDHSAEYARIYQDDTARLAGTTLTTWSNSLQSQSLPVYAGVQEILQAEDGVYIRASGLGSFVMGPWYDSVARTTLYPNLPVNCNVLFRLPWSPTASADKLLVVSQAGLAVDGVILFSAEDGISYSSSGEGDGVTGSGGDGVWNRDAFFSESAVVDPGYAHVQKDGIYHYHGSPIALRYQLGDHIDFDSATKIYTPKSGTPTNHSPIIGWALDGYPIYGPYGYGTANNPASGIRRMVSGYVLRNGQNNTTNLNDTGRASLPAWAQRIQGLGTLLPTQKGPDVDADYPLGHYTEDNDYLGDLGYTQGTDFDLDEYNGRFCVTPEFPGGTYAYFSCVTTNGTPTYPYHLGREFYGDSVEGFVESVPETVSTNYVGGPAVDLKLSTPTTSGGVITLKWSGVEGGSYIVEGKTNLSSLAWTTITNGVVPVKTLGQATDSMSGSPQRFYRVRRIGIEPYDTRNHDELRSR